jgi:hypothetical protein
MSKRRKLLCFGRFLFFNQSYFPYFVIHAEKWALLKLLAAYVRQNRELTLVSFVYVTKVSDSVKVTASGELSVSCKYDHRYYNRLCPNLQERCM